MCQSISRWKPACPYNLYSFRRACMHHQNEKSYIKGKNKKSRIKVSLVEMEKYDLTKEKEREYKPSCNDITCIL